MLIVRKNVDEINEETVVVSKVVEGWKLSGMAGTTPWEFTFDTSLVTDRPDIAFLVTSRMGKPELVWTSEIFNDRVSHAHVMGRINVSSVTPIAVFAIDENGETHCFVSNPQAHVGELECVIDESPETQSEILIKHIPSFANYFQKLQAKSKLLAGVRTTDSLAALEAQLDMLTTLVGDLIERLADGEKPAFALQLMDINKRVGAASVHPVEKLLADLEAHKTKIRALQSKYFEMRDEVA